MKARYTSVGVMVVLVGYVAAASAAVPSAKLSLVQGRVLVGQDTAMTPAVDGMPLYPGNRVVAIAGAGAQVEYAGGCAVSMPENSALAIEGADQCADGRAQVRTTAGSLNAAGGIMLGGLALTTTQVVVGAIVGVGAITAVVVNNTNNDDNNASR